MRILVDGLPNEIGGIGSLLVNFISYTLSKQEYQDIKFEFLLYDKSSYIPWLEKNKIKYYCSPEFGKQFLKYKTFILELFEKEKFDYIWINNTSKINYWLPYYAKTIAGSKVIFHSHGSKTEERGIKKIAFNLIDKINRNKFQKIADIKFACSEAAADYYYKGKDFRQNVTIIKNGISVEQFCFNISDRNKIRNSQRLLDEHVAIAIVGRFSKVKNQKFAISLMKFLPPKYKLFLFGDGPMYEQLKEEITKNDVEEQVVLMGNVSNLNEYLSAMDLFLMPSIHEGLPFSIIEAQASGLPCIVTSRLSKEMNISNHVKYVSLLNKDEWLRDINNIDYYNRAEGVKNVIQNGFSIENSVKLFYEKLKECN